MDEESPPKGPHMPSHYGIHGDTMIVNKQTYFANAHEHVYMNKQNNVLYKTIKQARVHNKLRPFAGTIPDNF